MAMVYYSNPQRAAEESRRGIAISKDRYPVVYEGRRVMANVIYEHGDYRLTFAGKPLTTVRGTPYFHLIDSCRAWRPM